MCIRTGRSTEPRRERKWPRPFPKGRSGCGKSLGVELSAVKITATDQRVKCQHLGHGGVFGDGPERHGGASGPATQSATASPTIWRTLSDNADQVRFSDGQVQIGGETISFAQAAASAYEKPRLTVIDRLLQGHRRSNGTASQARAGPFLLFCLRCRSHEVGDRHR